MRRTLVAFGTAGACIAEAVIHTCATGAIYIQDQLDILQLGNRNDPAVLRLQSAAAQYETFCQYTAGSRTSIKLYQTDIPRAGYEANESDPLAGLNNATGDQGLDAAIAWQTLWNQNMPQLLCSQEDSHIILCGFLGSYTGGIGMATLARALRSMPGDQALRIDMIGLLPFWRCTDDPAVTERTRCISSAMLRHYREQNLIADSDEQDLPAVDSACLMGLPMGAWAYLTAAEGTAPQMLHWIAARAVHDFFVTSGRFGVYTMGLAKDEMFWDAFGREGGAYQSAFNAMAMAAMLYRTELEPVIAARMHDTRLLRSLRKDWFTSRFGDAKRLSDPDGLLGRIQDIGEYYRLWCCWMAAMIHSLPPQLRDSEARDAAMQSAGEAYRQLLDAAGELYILQSEIDRSGMAEEQMVRRGSHTETTADRFLSVADSLREKLTRLEQVQASHDAIIGGMGKLALINQMLGGVEHAITAEEDHCEKARQTLMKTSVTMDDMALHAAQDGIHRIEIHIQTLQGRRERLLADRHAALSPAMQQLRPSIPGEKYYPRNALMNGELLALLGESHPNAEQIHAQWSTLLPGTEMDTPDVLLRRLADERRDKNDTTDPLPALMDMLHRIAAEGVRYSEG